MNMEDVNAALVALDCDMQITRILLGELIAQSPEPERILRRLQSEVDAMSASRPAEVGLEQVVELRARAEQTVALVRRSIASASQR